MTVNDNAVLLQLYRILTLSILSLLQQSDLLSYSINGRACAKNPYMNLNKVLSVHNSCQLQYWTIGRWQALQRGIKLIARTTLTLSMSMKSRSNLVPSAPPIFSVTYWKGTLKTKQLHPTVSVTWLHLLICFFKPANAILNPWKW